MIEKNELLDQILIMWHPCKFDLIALTEWYPLKIRSLALTYGDL